MNQRFHLIGPLLVISLVLAIWSAYTASRLVREQKAAAADMRDDVASHLAAAELEECVVELIALVKDRVRQVVPIHDRAEKLLENAEKLLMDSPDRQQLGKIRDSFHEHMDAWNDLPQSGNLIEAKVAREIVQRLEKDLLRPSHQLEVTCSQRLQREAEEHSKLLRRTTWGLVWVGGLGGIAGLVFGFGVSQGVSRSIRRLQFQVRDAAGKLDSAASEIVLTGNGNVVSLHDEMDSLTARIERFVAMLQQRDREVLRAEQLAALGQLAAGVAHEVRNPLTSIKLLVQAELEDSSHGGMAAEDLRIIESEVLRMERSLQTFLDYARLTDPERKLIDLETVVQNVMGLVRVRASRQRVEMQLVSPSGGVQISADMNQMQQVVLNLALNALDVMPQKGTLSFTIEKIGSYADLTVDDTGPGIASEMSDRLFQPFATNKETGLGLGLVIIRRIVEAHGGQVTVESAPGRGARFRVRLPFSTPALAGVAG